MRAETGGRARNARSFLLALLWALACTIVLAGCGQATLRRSPDPAEILSGKGPELRFLGEQRIPHRLEFGGTIVGGLSGIDYDPASGLYYLISDDRSQMSPARFYTATLDISAAGFRDARLEKVVTLLAPDGKPYRPKPGLEVPDGEAIRYDPRSNTLLWSSEGERSVRGDGRNRLIDPWVRESTLDGRHLAEMPLPAMFHITDRPRGPRDNLVFEGLSLSTDGRSLWVGMEAPLIQDGPLPDVEHGALVRISRFARSGDQGLLAQYAYPLEPLPAEPLLKKTLALNGASEILALSDTRLLVLERAFVLGHGFTVRLYLASTEGATDVANIDALPALSTVSPAPIQPMKKRLLLDFASLGITVDNLEGLCFGPTLANGHRTLVLVSDDNFNPGEVTQLIALEMLEAD